MSGMMPDRLLAWEYLKIRRKPADEPWDENAALVAWCAEDQQVADELEYLRRCHDNPEEAFKADMERHDNLTPEERRAAWGDDY